MYNRKTWDNNPHDTARLIMNRTPPYQTAVLFQFSRYPQFLTAGEEVTAIVRVLLVYLQLLVNCAAKLIEFCDVCNDNPNTVRMKATRQRVAVGVREVD